MNARRKERRVRAAPPSSRASVAICQSETHTGVKSQRYGEKEGDKTGRRAVCCRQDAETGGTGDKMKAAG